MLLIPRVVDAGVCCSGLTEEHNQCVTKQMYLLLCFNCIVLGPVLDRVGLGNGLSLCRFMGKKKAFTRNKKKQPQSIQNENHFPCYDKTMQIPICYYSW